MNVKNCKKCGVVFFDNGQPICLACKSKDEDDFKRIKEYLYDHPQTTFIELSKILEISVEKIRRFVREGRLEVKESALRIECENCGEIITSGKYCDKCQSNLMRGISSASKVIRSDIQKNKKDDDEKPKPKGAFYSRTPYNK
jgi:flagellar operon protein (TIGR03826 family)